MWAAVSPRKLEIRAGQAHLILVFVGVFREHGAGYGAARFEAPASESGIVVGEFGRMA
jgi:hypothetical protein